MLAPPPEPPRPGLSPPEGDIASDPLLPPGIPTVEPGWEEITTPEPPLLPPPLLGGASADPESPGPPRPVPFLPEPESAPEPMDGGGGTTSLARSVPLPEAPEFPDPDGEPEAPTDGGGGMTLDAPRDEPLVRVEPAPPVPELEPAIDGGGGTTSWVPKSFPMTLLTKPELACVGGGGTTAAEGSVALPLSSRRRSCAESAEGGGATT